MLATEPPMALIADDHVEMARLIAGALADDGWTSRIAGTGTAAIAAASACSPDLVITDLRMPDGDGLAVLEATRRDSAVIVMSAFGGVDTAVEAMRRGAWLYVPKPVRLAELVRHARRALDERRARPLGHAIIGASAAMRELASAVGRVAGASAPVLLRGESGTGKELVARSIHAASPRRSGPFVALNCAAIPEQLVESELFGHVRGAFTGAASDRPGVFREADGGTLLLDEVGDMPLPSQAKLLRVLQEREVRPVGGGAVHRVDVRVIAATHQDLEARVARGELRADLYYRLAVVPLTVPPLRDRTDDIPSLATHFLARARAACPDSPVERFSDGALAALCAHPWPGNVRELENLVERLVILGGQPEITDGDVRAVLPAAATPSRLRTLREVEDNYIDGVLAQCAGSKTRAAEILGVDPSTLYRRRRRG